MSIFGIPAAITLCLGVWQTRRYLWKVDVIKERGLTLNKNTTSFSPEWSDPKVLSQHLYNTVELEGEFDHSNEVLVGLRQSPISKREYVQSGRSKGSEMGYYLVTPMVIQQAQNQYIVWVNRGWVPRDLSEQASRLDLLPTGKTKIVAVISEAETQNSSVVESGQVKDKWWVTVRPSEFTADRYKTTPANTKIITSHVFDQTGTKDATVNAKGEINYHMLQQFERDNPSLPLKKCKSDHMEFYVSPEKHATYALTWYGLFTWVVSSAVYLARKGKL